MQSSYTGKQTADNNSFLSRNKTSVTQNDNRNQAINITTKVNPRNNFNQKSHSIQDHPLESSPMQGLQQLLNEVKAIVPQTTTAAHISIPEELKQISLEMS